MTAELPSPLPIRILVVDDDEIDFWIINDFIQDIPEQKFQIDWCKSYKDGSIALRTATHDLYLIDYYLGAKTGIDLLKEALKHECKEPIILLTGQGNHDIDLEAMRSGAADYLIKSQLTSEQLDRCIRYSIERVSTLKESRASERKFRRIFERSKDVIFIANEQLDFININNAATDLSGYLPHELLNFNISKLFSNQSDKEEVLLKLLQKQEVIDFNMELLTKQNVLKSCILSASIETDGTEKTYVQGIIRDISIEKRVEEIKLQSEKLEAKGIVIRTLAHEIRNPLHNIILTLGFMKSEASDDNIDYLNVIDRNSARINDLINELMDSNQYYKMKLEVIPLQIVMKEVIEKSVDQLLLNNVKLNFSSPSSDALVLVDKEKIKVAFLNIIVNAIEAMKQENGQLTITIFSEKDFHKVKIEDNGCGMSKESVSKLFEPYFTTKPNGMGLGLAATSAILQSHKVDVEVYSVENEGTAFTLTFSSL